MSEILSYNKDTEVSIAENKMEIFNQYFFCSDRKPDMVDSHFCPWEYIDSSCKITGAIHSHMQQFN